MKKLERYYQLTIFLFIQYILITGILMLIYNGGSFFNSSAQHFIFNQNYLSDLGRTVTFNGIQNPQYIFYTVTLCLVGLGVAIFFILISIHINSIGKYLVAIFGIISGLAYIGIAINPVDTSLTPHLFYGRLSFLLYFFACLGLQFLIDKKQYQSSYKCLLILNVIMFLYILLLFFGPPSSKGLWVLQIKTTAQKVIVYSMMLSSLVIVFEHKRLHS